MGGIRYVRNRRAKNLAIRIGRDGDVRVTVPGYVSLKRAEAFVFSKRRWILQKISERASKSETALSVKEGDILAVRGRQITVNLKGNQDSIEEAIWRILHKEAAAFLPNRVEELAREHGLSYSGVKVRRMKSRWGSCNARNGINLNSWLVMLPDHLSDYVILHELAHTRHRDHSPRFWEYLDGLTVGRSKLLRKELRAQQIMLIDSK
ncbi:MAG: M48 family metallopeptidase [Bacteroidetes bacterium]|nr:M48 family metallopeptidase [Bacteroidota bacterium]